MKEREHSHSARLDFAISEWLQPLRLGKLKTQAYLSLSSFLSDDSKSLKRYLGPKESKSVTVTVTGARLPEFIVVCIKNEFKIRGKLRKPSKTPK